jgi:hypothetical protein
MLETSQCGEQCLHPAIHIARIQVQYAQAIFAWASIRQLLFRGPGLNYFNRHFNRVL